MTIFTDTCCMELTAVVVILCSALIWVVRRNFNHWHRLGIKSPTWGHPLLGQAAPIMRQELSFGEISTKIYKEMKSEGLRFGGYYLPLPVLIPIDPILIKHIMQKDFDHFVNRGVYYNEKDDPISAHLFSIEDAKWKTLRAKITPTFTSGKMRMMFETVLMTSNRLQHVLDKINEKDSIEMKDVLARLTTDIIGSCAFGLDCNSLNNPDTDFRKYGKKALTTPSFIKSLKLFFEITFPTICCYLGVCTIDKDVSRFYMDVLRKTVSYREDNNVSRKDFLQLLIQLKNQSGIDDDTGNDASGQITFNELAAQSFIFFLAGFETSSSTMAYTVYELCMNLEIQDKVRKEVERGIEKYGDLTYDGIMEMHYLDMVVNETLRKYPTLPILNRVVTKDYKIPDTDIILKKGSAVLIPVEGLHHDPEYYPNPDVYDPERFTEENKKSRPAFTYLPFGEGPRICIGLRFGLLQTKVGLATLLYNYHMILDKSKTNVPLKLDPKSFLMGVQGGIFVHIKRINRDT